MLNLKAQTTNAKMTSSSFPGDPQFPPFVAPIPEFIVSSQIHYTGTEGLLQVLKVYFRY